MKKDKAVSAARRRGARRRAEAPAAQGQGALAAGPLDEQRQNASLTRRLRERMKSVAKEVPYARALARKICAGLGNGDSAQMADVVVDSMLRLVLNGHGPLMKELWARLEGKPEGQEDKGAVDPIRSWIDKAEGRTKDAPATEGGTDAKEAADGQGEGPTTTSPERGGAGTEGSSHA